MSHQSQSPHEIADEITPSQAEQVRCSKQREERLQAYAEGLLPPHLEAKVDVAITPGISTAAVLPATAEALLDADETDLPRSEIQQLVERIDGEYLILVTGQPAPTDVIPGDDQITADKAHQFGLVFHETLHILKTAIGSIGELLTKEVDDQYADLVHDLFNTIEDGAIEGEAINGNNFSDNAGVRLSFTRRIHSLFPDDLDEDNQAFTFWDAVTATLYECAIYPTGIVDVLLDPDDSRATFESADAREVFLGIKPELERLAEEGLAIRSSARDDVAHRHDKEASIKRAKRVLETWHSVLKPLLEDPSQEQESNQQQPPSSQTDEHDDRADRTAREKSETEPDSEQQRPDQSPDAPDAGTEPQSEGEPTGDDPGEADNESEPTETTTIEPTTNPASADGVADPSELDINPEDLTTDRGATDDPFQDVLDRPEVNDDPDVEPDDVELNPEDMQPSGDDTTDSDNDSDDGESGTEGDGNQTEDGDKGDSVDNSTSGDEKAQSQSDTDRSPSEHGPDHHSEEGDTESAWGDETSASEDGIPSETTGESETEGDEQTESESKAEQLASHTSDSNGSSGDGGQLTIGDFAKDADSETSAVDSDEPDPGSSAGDCQADAGETEFDESDTQTVSTSSEASERSETSADGDANDEAEEQSANSESQSNAGPKPEPEGKDREGADGSNSDNTDGPTAAEEQIDRQDDSDGVAPDTEGSSEDTGSDEVDRPESTPEADRQSADEQNSPDTEGTSDSSHSDGRVPAPAHGGTESEPDFDSDALGADSDHQQRTTDGATIDEDALAEELEALERQFDDDDDGGDSTDTSRGQHGAGSDAGPGSLDDLSILPQRDETVESSTWEEVEAGAEQVGNTLAKELQLDRQSASRSGLTSGSFDSSKGHRLSYGDPSVFKRDMPGDEKRYSLVLVLDRSGSMDNGSPRKIETATAAIARFALAAEELEIEVAVIDFYRGEARLVKPFSVDVEHAQAALMADQAGGGTPLSDALALARNLIQSRSEEPLIVTITDDKPDRVDAVSEEIKGTYAPVCSLTIATDCRRGSPPAKAERLEQKYDRTATVFNPERLDDRLDQFASLLGGY